MDLRNFASKSASLALLALVASVAARAAHATDYFVSASVMNDEVADDAALDTCLTSAIASGGACVLPEGTLVLSIYPAALRQQTPSGILDLNGATLRGQGADTVIKGVSADGFDVLQLNGAAHFNIRDLSITTEVTNTVLTHGVNGISMTNGTHDIRIQNVHVHDLPFVQKTGYVDGGKAFTVQSGTYNTGIPLRDIYVEQSSSQNVNVGFWMDCDTNTNVEPDNINVIGNTFEGYQAGIVFSFVQPTTPMSVFGAAILDNAVRGGKYGIAVGRGRAYYVKGNYVVLDDTLSQSLDYGDFIPSRQTLLLNDVDYITAELNTFELDAGDYFLRAVDANPTDHIFRFNNFYGNPTSRTYGTSPAFQAYFDSAGTFY